MFSTPRRYRWPTPATWQRRLAEPACGNFSTGESKSSLGPELQKTGGRIFYSYRDVLALRTFVYLREEHSLQLIRRAMGTLRDLENIDHLSKYSLVADGKQIILLEEQDVVDLTSRPGELVAAFMRDVLEPFINMQGVKVVDLRRPRRLVSVDPDTQGGYPVIAGTRIQFDLVASLVADGVSPGEIKDFYPGVSAAAARDSLLRSDRGRVPRGKDAVCGVKILLDENVPQQALPVLQRTLRGHEIDHVDLIHWKGKKDPNFCQI